ncbi:MAG TPA: serine hydrolase [Bryobacteraceae bacterium]|nr:serine hydrolase [Bryobacteraceae bacterium]
MKNPNSATQLRTLLPFLLVCSAFAADNSSQIDALLSRYAGYGLFNGAALVADHGRIIFEKGYGLANMEWNTPNTPDTKFRLGSITKQFTATLVMQLVEQGKISLSAPIAAYLADYPKPAADRITIHELLNHTSGIPGYTELPEFGAKSREASKPADFVAFFSQRPLLFEPGSKFSYSNSAYFLLGVILEKVTGQPYERLLRERILDRAGMHDTGYDSTAPLLPKRAWGYDSTLNGYRNASYIDMSLPFSAGSLYSTAEDLFRWDRALYTDQILTRASKDKMFTPGLSDYGYGWFIRKGAVTTVEHDGGINGFNTLISRDLEPQRLIVLLNNTGGAPLDAMAAGIRAILNGRDPELPKQPAAPVLLKTYESSGLAAMLQQIQTFQSNAVYDASENQLSRLAAYLMGIGKNEDALALAKVIAEKFPKSAGAETQLARAYQATGNRTEARSAYARAMELSETPRAFPILQDAIQKLSR